MSGTTNGGARPGAGRKPNSERYAEQLGTAADHLASRLLEVAEAQAQLALGEIPGEKWVLAGLVTRKDVLRKKRPSDWPADEPFDDVWTDDKGKPVVIDAPLFPELPPGKLIRIEQYPGKPDIKAIIEIWARLGGKPGQIPPVDPESIDLRAALTLARLARAAYVDPDAQPPADVAGDEPGIPDDDAPSPPE
jgi:hypothetical protein